MKSFTQFKSEIKAANTIPAIRQLYAEAMTIIDHEPLFSKVIDECVKKEYQLIH